MHKTNNFHIYFYMPKYVYCNHSHLNLNDKSVEFEVKEMHLAKEEKLNVCLKEMIKKTID